MQTSFSVPEYLRLKYGAPQCQKPAPRTAFAAQRDGVLKHLLQGTLAYAGLQVLPPFIGWHVPYVSDEARHQILELWRSRIRSVDDATPLQFPSLADYDDRLHPLTADSNAV